MRKEELGHRRVPARVRRGTAERREAAAAFSRVHVGACRKKHLRDLEAAVDVRLPAEAARSGVQRRIRPPAASAGVGVSGHQQSHNCRTSVLRRDVQRPLIELVPCIDVRAAGDQQVREILPSPLCGNMQQRFAERAVLLVETARMPCDPLLKTGRLSGLARITHDRPAPDLGRNDRARPITRVQIDVAERVLTPRYAEDDRQAEGRSDERPLRAGHLRRRLESRRAPFPTA